MQDIQNLPHLVMTPPMMVYPSKADVQIVAPVVEELGTQA